MDSTLRIRDQVLAVRALTRLLAGEKLDRTSLDPLYRRVAAVVEALGDPASALDEIAAGKLVLDTAGLFQTVDTSSAIQVAEKEVAAWRAAELKVAALGSHIYPQLLREIADPPPLLFVKGDIDVLARPGIAIVGSRRVSDEGRRRAARAAQVLADAGFAVFSGLAKGIDRSAHLGALSVRGITIAVMGTPIDKRYPAEHSALADDIVQCGGALVSEFVPTTRTVPWHFLRRNRTMSGLSLATLVVEASETSGARSQAKAALEHGRPVFLPKSLVESHAWAETLVSKGYRGARAIEVSQPDEIAEALSGLPNRSDDVSF